MTLISKAISLALSSLILLSSSGCTAGDTINADDLMVGVTAQKIQSEITHNGNAAMTEFAVSLLQGSYAEDSKNALVSPLSVISALGMTASGAAEETLAQMEAVFGMTSSELNKYINAYFSTLSQYENEKAQLRTANSLWINDNAGFVPNTDFLQTNADFYGADIYEAPFDSSTLGDINRWVSDNTDGKIRDILDRIPSDAIMYLVNALAFDAEWEEPYYEHMVKGGTFTGEDGTVSDAEMLAETEYRTYFEDDNTKGFLKEYVGGRFAFAALLPDKDIKMSDYIASLTSEKLTALFENAQNVEVRSRIPKFKCEYGAEMSELLIQMGMTNAFDSNIADFSAMGKLENPGENLCIDRVIHKTFLSLDEKGTEAGAATIVEMDATSAMPEKKEEPKEVILDRPFVYMLIDIETNVPFFIGALSSLE